jgi:hypothetical protein
MFLNQHGSGCHEQAILGFGEKENLVTAADPPKERRDGTRAIAMKMLTPCAASIAVATTPNSSAETGDPGGKVAALHFESYMGFG